MHSCANREGIIHVHTYMYACAACRPISPVHVLRARELFMAAGRSMRFHRVTSRGLLCTAHATGGIL